MLTIVQPSSGSSPGVGGVTATSESVGSLAAGASHTMTHHAVPLTSGAISFSALRKVNGASHNSLTITWTYEDLNENGATWVQDSGADGHFSVAPGTRVKKGCYVNVGSTEAIAAMTGDGTAPSSVTLSSSVASTSITWIHSLTSDFGNIRTTSYNGDGTVPGVFSYGISDILKDSSTYNPITSAQFGRVVDLNAEPSNATNPRGAISPDGGVTWYAFDGDTWSTLSLENLATSGCVLAGDWKDSGGLANLTAQNLADLRDLCVEEGSEMDLRLAVGMQGADNSAIITSIHLNVAETDYHGIVQLSSVPVQGMGGTPGIMGVKRISTTQAQFSMPSYGDTFEELILTAWTES